MDENPFDRLGDELDAAARRQLAGAVKSRRRRRSFGLLAAIVALPSLAATAWAASALISQGSPVAYQRGAPVSGTGVGTPVPASVRMLTASIEDPDGDLPWGLRSFRTTRGMACLQIGRVYEGKLGVLGRDGSFGNDGRFHELRPSIHAQCFPPDGAGNAYLTHHDNAYLASGEPCRGSGCRDARTVGRPSEPAPDPIDPTHLRSVDFGLLGPEATSITYRDGARFRTAPTLGEGGGYLVVGPPLKPAAFPEHVMKNPRYANIARFSRSYTQDGGSLSAMTPASRVITSVRYGDTARCDVKVATIIDNGRRTGGCPDPPGFVAIPQAQPDDVRTKVTATAIGPREIRVSFVARVAVRDRLSAYNVMVKPPRSGRPCCDGASGSSTDRNIPAGHRIVKNVMAPRRLRPGRYTITVSLRTQSPHPSPGGNLQYPGTIAGRTTLVVR